MQHDAGDADVVVASFKLIVQYDGARYKGFQRQMSNAERPSKLPRYDHEARKQGVVCTIQDCIEEACLMWLRQTFVASNVAADTDNQSTEQLTVQSLRLRFAGRTDKGVHARGQVVVVEFPKHIVSNLESWMIHKALNTRLPMDISVKSIELCDATFDPRHFCVRKQYTYTIRYRQFIPNRDARPEKDMNKVEQNGGPYLMRTAFDSPILWICPWVVDDSNIINLCKSLSGLHDFSPFVHKLDRQSDNNTVDLKRFSFHKVNNQQNVNVIHGDVNVDQGEDTNASIVNAQFVLEAKRFGRSMVRNLVGFIMDQCRNNKNEIIQPDDIWKVDLKGKVSAAPASGLCLEHVWYE